MSAISTSFAEGFLDGLGAGLLTKLRRPGAPDELIDSRPVEEFLSSDDFAHIERELNLGLRISIAKQFDAWPPLSPTWPFHEGAGVSGQPDQYEVKLRDGMETPLDSFQNVRYQHHPEIDVMRVLIRLKQDHIGAFAAELERQRAELAEAGRLLIKARAMLNHVEVNYDPAAVSALHDILKELDRLPILEHKEA